MFNIGICDDEKLTCEDLEEKVQKFGDKIQMKMNMRIWHSGEELCDALEEGLELDLLFLDIELITTNGVIIGDFIRNSLENVETEIIYISSKSSYAMSLFKIQPLEFLMKPLDEKKVWRAALRWVHIMEMKNKNFAYSIKGEYYKVPFKDIIYFYSDNKKVVIVLKNKKIHFNGKLKDVAKKVTTSFIFIHRSFLINLDYVERCSYEFVNMMDGSSINISRTYRKYARSKIMEYKWERMG